MNVIAVTTIIVLHVGTTGTTGHHAPCHYDIMFFAVRASISFEKQYQHFVPSTNKHKHKHVKTHKHIKTH